VTCRREASREDVVTAVPDADARAAGDGGLVTTELVLVTPLLVAFLFLLLAAGRLVDAKSDVVSAANDAARVASLQTSYGAAQQEAKAAAEATLAGEGLNCQGGVDVDLQVIGSGFTRGNVVQANVSCDVQTSDLGLIADVLGSVVTVSDHSREPIDTYRSE
jgi:Flp pilus assembly protein TadG